MKRAIYKQGNLNGTLESVAKQIHPSCHISNHGSPVPKTELTFNCQQPPWQNLLHRCLKVFLWQRKSNLLTSLMLRILHLFMSQMRLAMPSITLSPTMSMQLQWPIPRKFYRTVHSQMVWKWYDVVWEYDACFAPLPIQSAEYCYSWLSFWRTAVYASSHYYPRYWSRWSQSKSLQLFPTWPSTRQILHWLMQTCCWHGNGTCEGIQAPTAQPITAQHPSDVQRCQYFIANYRQDHPNLSNQNQNRKAPIAPTPQASLWWVSI